MVGLKGRYFESVAVLLESKNHNGMTKADTVHDAQTETNRSLIEV